MPAAANCDTTNIIDVLRTETPTTSSASYSARTQRRGRRRRRRRRRLVAAAANCDTHQHHRPAALLGLSGVNVGGDEDVGGGDSRVSKKHKKKSV